MHNSKDAVHSTPEHLWPEEVLTMQETQERQFLGFRHMEELTVCHNRKLGGGIAFKERCIDCIGLKF